MGSLCHLSALPQPRRARLRILVFIFLIGYCYLTFFSISSDVFGRNHGIHLPMEDAMQKRSLGDCDKVTAGVDSQITLSPGIRDMKAHDIESRFSDRFRAALGNILTMLPDQLHMRDFLGPIGGTGEEKLREVGFRARVLKRILKAWEALHLVPVGDEIYNRNNVVQLLQSRPELARSFNSDHVEIIHTYENYRYFLTHLSMRLFPWIVPYFSELAALHTQFWARSRGIVFTAGDKQAPYLLTSIRSIRNQGCDLPIEVMYLGNDDLSESSRDKLESLPNVVSRDLSLMVHDEGWRLAGWAAKPFAILLSSFREVIFIDADALFFRNPEELFSEPSYQETGALFFKDRLIMPESKKDFLRQILPMPISKQARSSRFWTGESGHMQESGVVVVDKWRHFVALLTVARMNGPDRDGNKAEGRVGVYDMVFGDKETFWLGWELVGDLDYAFHGGDTAVMGIVQVNYSGGEPDQGPAIGEETGGNAVRNMHFGLVPANFTICAPQLLHLDVAGRPLWFNGWLQPNKFSEDGQPAEFEAFITEPKDEPGPWKLGDSNSCCLTSDHVSNFTRGEKKALKWIIETAKDIGSVRKS